MPTLNQRPSSKQDAGYRPAREILHGKEGLTLAKAEHEFFREDRFRRALVRASLRAALRAIEQCLLPADRDGEGSVAITNATTERAKELLADIRLEADGLDLHWSAPVIGPTADGEVDLAWQVDDRWLVLSVDAGVAGVGCTRQSSETAPTFQVESHRDAVQAAIWALSAG